MPPSDPAALAAALAELLRDPARAAAMGAAGQRRWSERFTAERMVRATEAIYREELARAGRGAARMPAPAAEVAR